MKKKILAISGRPGLYFLVSQGRAMLIVETIDEKRHRMPVGARDRVTSLNDVAIYTTADDVPLMQVFEAMKGKFDGKPVDWDYRKAPAGELGGFMAEVLPDYDRDRVRLSDIRKLIQWYNILAENGITDFADQPE